MDDLDALLNDLQHTNNALLGQGHMSGNGTSVAPGQPSLPAQQPYSYQGNNSRNSYDEPYSYGSSDYRQRWEAPPKQQRPADSEFSKQPPQNHQQRGGLNANMQELNHMLEGLDQPDFLNDVRIKSEEYDYRNSNGSLSSKNSTLRQDLPRQQPQGNGGRHFEAAAEDLDNLMVSLNKFKVTDNAPNGLRQQQESSELEQRSGTPQSDLDRMLGHLSTDMNRQGVDTTAKGHCAACNKPIQGKMITALGQCWHLEHFVCSDCQESLGSQNFYERDQQPYCESCYQHNFSPKCAYCNEPILDKCLTAMDRAWHPEHFFCSTCQCSFEEGIGFHERDNKPYCPDCFFDNYGPKCGGCNLPITDTYISALNKQWHNHCFVCQDCQKGFGGGSFFELDGLPYCENHFHAKRGSLCHSCNNPVTGRCINALGRKYHPEHFVCSFCLKELNKGTFKEQTDKPYCHECFVKLFG